MTYVVTKIDFKHADFGTKPLLAFIRELNTFSMGSIFLIASPYSTRRPDFGCGVQETFPKSYSREVYSPIQMGS